MRSANEILDEIRRIKCLKSDATLGKLLGGAAQTTVASWRGRNTIPFTEIIEFCVTEGISIDSLLWENQLSGTRENDTTYCSEQNPQIKEITSIMVALDDQAREEVLIQAREKRELFELRKEKEREAGFTEPPQPKSGKKILKGESTIEP